MIHVYGTSHVSQDSIEVIDRAFEEKDPDMVALEIDMVRLNALLTGQDQGSGTLFLRLLKRLQERIGSKTGLMPGEEMKYAFNRAMQENREVALIDQDIRITIDRLNQVSRKEKVKAVGSLLAGLALPGSFDLSSIPETGKVRNLVEEFRDRFPGLYRVLVEERNIVMAEALKNLQQENPESEIVAIVGAGHEEEIREMLD